MIHYNNNNNAYCRAVNEKTEEGEDSAILPTR